MGTLVVKTSTSPITMKTSIALAVVALALSANAKPDFDSCPGVDNTPFVNPFHLSVKPDPVVLKKGEQVKIGSCDYDAETLLDMVPADLCSKFAPAGEDCKLPLMAGKYGDQDPAGAAVIDITDDIPAIIKTIVNGDIKVEAHAMDASGKEILCIQNTVTITTN